MMIMVILFLLVGVIENNDNDEDDHLDYDTLLTKLDVTEKFASSIALFVEKLLPKQFNIYLFTFHQIFFIFFISFRPFMIHGDTIVLFIFSFFGLIQAVTISGYSLLGLSSYPDFYRCFCRFQLRFKIKTLCFLTYFVRIGVR